MVRMPILMIFSKILILFSLKVKIKIVKISIGSCIQLDGSVGNGKVWRKSELVKKY